MCTKCAAARRQLTLREQDHEIFILRVCPISLTSLNIGLIWTRSSGSSAQRISSIMSLRDITYVIASRPDPDTRFFHQSQHYCRA